MSEDFSAEQKRYLEGFASGLQIAQARERLQDAVKVATPSASVQAAPLPNPDAALWAAQDRATAEGVKLVAEEKAKRERHPLDRWDELLARSRASEFPRTTDIFMTKYFGLFYVAPAQQAYMCRLRLPNGLVTAAQLQGIASLAEQHAGAYVDITTRANLQLREIPATSGPAVVTGLQDLGIVTRGAGADNIRNVTGSPTAGLDPQELLDTRPHAREMHHYILQNRDMYGLPRKFNIAFDGGGQIAALDETNDIGFRAVAITGAPGTPDGIYFRVYLGGITGHGDFARDCGVIVAPAEAVALAAAMVRVFLAHGGRGDRSKARLKYLLDGWGIARFLEAAEQQLGKPLLRVEDRWDAPRPPINRMAHIGAHAQRETGRYWIGAMPEQGRITSPALRAVATLASRYGSGDIRLTVWQSLLIADVASADVHCVLTELEGLGLHPKAHPVRAGSVACTGSSGCKFAAANTKSALSNIVRVIEQDHPALDRVINIHITGCHHSCAQHYIGDIGLIACKISGPDDSEVEGFHVYLGGGHGVAPKIATEYARNIPIPKLPALISSLIAHYLQHRSSAEQAFADFMHARDRPHLPEPIAA